MVAACCVTGHRSFYFRSTNILPFAPGSHRSIGDEVECTGWSEMEKQRSFTKAPDSTACRCPGSKEQARRAHGQVSCPQPGSPVSATPAPACPREQEGRSGPRLLPPGPRRRESPEPEQETDERVSGRWASADRQTLSPRRPVPPCAGAGSRRPPPRHIPEKRGFSAHSLLSGRG